MWKYFGCFPFYFWPRILFKFVRDSTCFECSQSPKYFISENILWMLNLKFHSIPREKKQRRCCGQCAAHCIDQKSQYRTPSIKNKLQSFLFKEIHIWRWNYAKGASVAYIATGAFIKGLFHATGASRALNCIMLSSRQALIF
jgi:hypothetical protein